MSKAYVKFGDKNVIATVNDREVEMPDHPSSGTASETMVCEMARVVFTERYRHCVGENWQKASEADRRSHRDMVAAALGCLREPNSAMLEVGADAILRFGPLSDIPWQQAMQIARRVVSLMAEAAIREAEERKELTP